MAKKKSKMETHEVEEYLKECDHAIEELRGKVNQLLAFDLLHVSLRQLRLGRAYLLRDAFPEALVAIQKPKESSDYSEAHLRLWRAEVRRLDDIANRFLKTLYKK